MKNTLGLLRLFVQIFLPLASASDLKAQFDLGKQSGLDLKIEQPKTTSEQSAVEVFEIEAAGRARASVYRATGVQLSGAPELKLDACDFAPVAQYRQRRRNHHAPPRHQRMRLGSVKVARRSMRTAVPKNHQLSALRIGIDFRKTVLLTDRQNKQFRQSPRRYPRPAPASTSGSRADNVEIRVNFLT